MKHVKFYMIAFMIALTFASPQTIHGMEDMPEVINSTYGSERFSNGKLIYRPTEGSDEGMIELRISELIDPSNGTFDLSQCGNAGEFLHISTGFPMAIQPADERKIGIWIFPRSLIEKQVGIVMSIGMLYSACYWQEYNVSKSVDDIPNETIIKLAVVADRLLPPTSLHLYTQKFHVCF